MEALHDKFNQYIACTVIKLCVKLWDRWMDRFMIFKHFLCNLKEWTDRISSFSIFNDDHVDIFIIFY